MGSIIAQIIAVVDMNFRSLPKRLWSSITTLLAVAIVVGVLLAFMAMGEGFRKTMQGSGSDDVAIMLRAGSEAELNSGLVGQDLKIVADAPGIVRNAEGPIVSGELYVVVDGIKKSSQTEANIPLRGITLNGVSMRDTIQIIAGRMFEPGKNEIVVGNGVLQEFSGFELGTAISLGGTEWKIVGVFNANGSVFGSELWADVRTVQNQFNRENTYQSIRVRLENTGDLEAIKTFVANDARLNLDVFTEKQYFSSQAAGMENLIAFGWVLAILMAGGALAGALNTMYTSVENKATEIATLRAIGFKGSAAFVGTLVESIVLAIIGGVLGTMAAFLLFDGISTSTMGGSFTQVVFDFNVSAEAFISGIFLALCIGLIGGVFPAWKASKTPLAAAFSS